ncbi:MAG: helix-turn-helix domain-containing protein [Lactobacillaceae bacterium]
MHRNTAVYRLKKLEKLLNMSLNDVSDSEQLRMATKLYLIHH